MVSFFFLVATLTVLVGCGGSGSTPPTPDAGPLPVDQCISSADRALLEGSADGGSPDGGLADPIVIGRDCARITCISQLLLPDPAPGRACMESCFAASALGGLTQGCQDCYIEGIYCTGYACPVECLGSDQSLCDACFEEQCKARTDACTGL